MTPAPMTHSHLRPIRVPLAHRTTPRARPYWRATHASCPPNHSSLPHPTVLSLRSRVAAPVHGFPPRRCVPTTTFGLTAPAHPQSSRAPRPCLAPSPRVPAPSPARPASTLRGPLSRVPAPIRASRAPPTCPTSSHVPRPPPLCPRPQSCALAASLALPGPSTRLGPNGPPRCVPMRPRVQTTSTAHTQHAPRAPDVSDAPCPRSNPQTRALALATHRCPDCPIPLPTRPGPTDAPRPPPPRTRTNAFGAAHPQPPRVPVPIYGVSTRHGLLPTRPDPFRCALPFPNMLQATCAWALSPMG